MPRGRLIYPFTVEIGLLDTVLMQADPDATGPLVSGYDDEFREPNIQRGAGSKPGQLIRKETVHFFKAQIEDDTEDMMQAAASGNAPENSIGLVFHYQDLESAGAVQVKAGKPIIKAPGARLISIRDPRDGKLIERYDGDPGFWATQAKSMGFGIGPYRNLLLVVFQERALSVQSTGS
jgi:hypothetical protein